MDGFMLLYSWSLWCLWPACRFITRCLMMVSRVSTSVTHVAKKNKVAVAYVAMCITFQCTIKSKK